MIVNVNITANTLRHTIIQMTEKDPKPNTSFGRSGRGKREHNQMENRLWKIVFKQ
jgi:hypothetical protein